MAEADEATVLFVPEPEVERFQASAQGQWFYVAKERVGIVASLQIVIRDAGTQVMDVVKADVPGEPLQDPGNL